MNNKEEYWWGYIHKNGTLHVKRFYSEGDIKEALNSLFVEKVITKFIAKNRDYAIKFIKNTI